MAPALSPAAPSRALSSSSLLTPAFLVPCPPLSPSPLLTWLIGGVQGEAGPLQEGDVLGVVDVLAMLWQYNLMGVELMLRHGVLVHLSSAAAIPGSELKLARLAAVRLLSLVGIHFESVTGWNAYFGVNSQRRQ
jgi:hypothetical protein